MQHLARQAARFGLAASIAIVTQSVAFAVPYASQVRNTGGSIWEFVLNQDADDVQITRDGGAVLGLGALSAGRYTFDLESFSTFDIAVSNSAPEGLARVSDPSNIFTEFRRPAGLAINRDPSSPFFGTVYVANGIASDAANVGRNSRAVGDGIYALRPDLQGVDFSTPAWAVPDPNDPAQARVGNGWNVTAETNSVFRISLDNAGNVIAGDWSDVTGGIKYIGPNLTGGGLLLAGENGEGYGQISFSAPLDGSVSPFIHSAVRGVPNVLAGSVGNGLVVAAVDVGLTRNGAGLLDGTYPNADLPDTDGDGFPIDSSHVWKWDVGDETNAETLPELLIDIGNNGGNPDFELGADSSGRPFLINQVRLVRGDAEYFPQLGENGLWVYTQPRFDGNESGIVFIKTDPSGVEAPEVVWSSRQWTIDNNLDGYLGTDPGATVPEDPNNDVFRNTGTVDVSEDGSTLYIHRWITDDANFVDDDGNPNPDVNPYLGRDSNLPGALLAVPLDENGLPVIEINDNGTPGNTLDDFFTNLQSIETTDQNFEFDEIVPPLTFPFLQENHEVEVDIAGNIYITDDVSRLIEVFTPGGDSATVYSFDGTTGSFAFLGEDPGLLGDYNADGVVDAADYTVFRDTIGSSDDLRADGNGNGVIDPDDYNVWVAAFGDTAAGAGFAAPEPAGALMVAVAMASGAASRRGRRGRVADSQ